MADERDEVRARIDIVDLIGQRVALKRNGKHYVGLCPFHQDRNPSFNVDPHFGRYRCWSCGEAGDIFTWVMKTENVEFAEALRELAAKAGVALKGRAPTVSASEKETWRSMMGEALKFFREQIGMQPEAIAYCRSRSLDELCLSDWELGYAPGFGEALVARLKRQGFALSECKKLFLVDGDEHGYFDKFRSRLIFPIRDERGELVAFGGRIVGEGRPKYINSSDTPLYRKSKVLYGMHRAREAMTAAKKAVLVEGYLDVIACHRGGVTNAVASLGTALAEEQIALLKRWVDEVVVLYDADEAGQKATDRAITLLAAEQVRVKVAQMAEGDDPDSLLISGGPGAVARVVEQAISPTEFRLANLEKNLRTDDQEFWSRAVAILAGATGRLEVERYLPRLASFYPGLKDVVSAQNALRKMVEAARGTTEPRQVTRGPIRKAAPETVPLSEPLTSPELTVFAALFEPPFQRIAWMHMVSMREIFATGIGAALAEAIAEAFPQEPPSGPAKDWIHRVEPEELRRVLSDIPHDFRAGRPSETTVGDSLAALRTAAERREIQNMRRKDLTQEDRAEIAARIKRIKMTRLDDSDEDDDPFA